jgi:2-C-methyl-D-erythritol 4-phosphate cytidylyltransferase/2-C-methyl-D-erythritol 2,4-cyclodiphosphate synthase
MKTISVILLAGGSGERLKKPTPKAFVKIQNKEMFLYSLETFEQHLEISEVILVVPKSHIPEAKKLVKNFAKITRVVSGGKTRMESLRNGLKQAKGDFILSHNAANPFVSASEISKCVKLLPKWKAVGVGQRASSTVRLESKTLNRKKIWLMETPQIVERKALEAGLRIAKKEKIEATDELQLAELAGEKVKVIAASEENRKITFGSDLEKTPLSRQGGTSPLNRGETMLIGLGVDSHRFSERKKALILGGVKISSAGGLEGNSDGDVLLHALTNAISSALGGGSLSLFADSICKQGITDSKKYLGVIVKEMKAENFEVENVSIAFEGKKPKLEKHFSQIKKSLAKLLSVSTKQIGITATSGEELTSFGRGEGLQVFVIVLLKSRC